MRSFLQSGAMERGGTLRILGVDPGSLRLGFGLLEASGSTKRLAASGVLDAPAAWAAARRLARLARELEQRIVELKPDCLALEDSFFGKNARSLLRLGEARGMVLALAGGRGLEVHDYPPAVVKKSVTGNGNATKEQVARVLAVLLPELRSAGPIARLDQTDAVAVAWCHAQRRGLDERRDALARALEPSGSASAGDGSGRLAAAWKRTSPPFGGLEELQRNHPVKGSREKGKKKE
jgi:crossover junction endodeoxyribonuclease RuvC